MQKHELKHYSCALAWDQPAKLQHKYCFLERGFCEGFSLARLGWAGLLECAVVDLCNFNFKGVSPLLNIIVVSIHIFVKRFLEGSLVLGRYETFQTLPWKL